MTTFEQMKSNRQSSIDKLVKELDKFQNPQGQSSEDTRFWKPEVDKSGNGYAVIRFLPAPKNEDVPFVRIWDHGFQGPGGWYIENSLTTLGKPDPVTEYNSKLWNSGIEANKDLVRKQKRRLHFISNILVVKDPSNPSNEGKVFLFKYGKKIFDKLNEAMNPQFDDEKPINPFDFWEGADFKLKIRMVEGYRNYDKSEFSAPSEVSDDDDVLKKIWNSEYSLQDFLAEKNFKSYNELKTRLERVLGDTTSTDRELTREEKNVDDEFAEISKPVEKKSAAPKSTKESPPWKKDEEDVDDFFKDLLND